MKSIKLPLLAAAAMLGAIVSASAADSGVPKDYPLTKCPVSDEPYGGDMKPYKVTHEGTDVWLCCKSCLKDFKKDPAKYAGMVKEASTKK
jgi:YHS domain-containing protein